MSQTFAADDDAPDLSMADTIKLAQELHDKYRDVPVALKMSRETFRQLVVVGNIKPSAEPISSLYGMPIVFDEEIPFGEVKEQFK